MDAFYASVEQRDNPSYRKRPVIVGGGLPRGVVSAASYEARRFGIHSAMPMARAVRLCPDGVFLPVRMDRYADVSRSVFGIFHEFTPLVEPLSLDEAFLDVTASESLFGPGAVIAEKIRRRVRDVTGLTVSAGVASNKFVAKVASDFEKPDGCTVVPADRIEGFLAPLPVGRIWGVGKVTEKALRGLGVRTIGELRRVSREVLDRRFGSTGKLLWELCRGIDERPVEVPGQAKSLGREDTYGVDLVETGEIRRCLLDLSGQVSRRLRRKGLCGKTVTLKVKYADFRQITRSVTLSRATDDDGEIYRAILPLLEKTEAGRRPVRLLGVSLSHLGAGEGERQLALFSDSDEKGRRLNETIDRLSDKYGKDVVRRSSLLNGS